MATVQQLFGATAAANTTSGLTGSELVTVDNGGATTQRATTAAIAALAGVTGTARVLTTINTVGAGSLTAAALIGGQINRTGVQTGAFTDTTVAASVIIAALPSGAPVGTSWTVTISNNQTAATNYVETIAGGSGVTIAGISTIPTGGAVDFFVTLATASTITMTGRLAAQSASTALALAGSTSGQTTLQANATAGSGVLTLPTTATDTLAALGTAQTFTAAQTFTNSDLILLGSSTGFTTFTSANAGATNFTLTLPAVTGTLAQTSGSNLYVSDIYRSASSTSLTNATPGAINGMSAMAVAIGTYRIRAVLPNTSNGTSGIAVSFVLTTAVLSAISTTAKNFEAAAIQTQYNSTATSGTNLFASTTASLEIVIDGTFTVSTAGTIALDAALNTGSTSAVIQAGAYCELTRIA